MSRTSGNTENKEKSNRQSHGTIQSVSGVIIFVLLWWVPSVGASVLSDTANSMAPGSWKELPTIGMSEEYLQFPGGNGAVSTQFMGEATWDSINQQVMFVASGHGNDSLLHIYDEATNTWIIGTQPTTRNHGYNHNAIAVEKRILGFSSINSIRHRIKFYDIETKTWEDRAALANDGDTAHALVYFPERGLWYLLDGSKGKVIEYNDTTDSFRTHATDITCFADPDKRQGGYYHNFASYNPVRQEIVFGGGNNGYGEKSHSLCRMDTQGNIYHLPISPAYLSIPNGGNDASLITIDPGTGDLIVLNQLGQMYAFDFLGNTWSEVPSHPSMPNAMKQTSRNVEGGFVAPIDTYGVVMYMDYATYSIWLYKHGEAQDDTIPPDPPQGLEIKEVRPVVGELSFEERCASDGVIFCQPFDELPNNTATEVEGIFSNHGSCASLVDRASFSCPEIDNGTLKFTVPSESGPGAEGQYYIRFADYNGGRSYGPGEEVFIQWKQKFSKPFLDTYFTSGPGWKQGMTGAQDEFSCSSNEIVVQNSWQRGFPTMYHACGLYAGFQTRVGQYDFDLQPGGPGGVCSYTESNQGGISEGCTAYVPDVWITYQIGITHGASGENSRIRLWVGNEGQPSKLAIDYQRVLVNTKGYGKFWMLPYHTNKRDSQVHPEGYIWYDELIIGSQKIPDPS